MAPREQRGQLVARVRDLPVLFSVPQDGQCASGYSLVHSARLDRSLGEKMWPELSHGFLTGNCSISRKAPDLPVPLSVPRGTDARVDVEWCVMHA